MSVSGVHQMLDTSVPPPSGGGKKSFCGIRSSKFKHVYGAPAKKNKCYDNIKITRNAGDSSFCAVNPKFLAVVVEVGGGGSFVVLPLGMEWLSDSYPDFSPQNLLFVLI